MAELLGSARYHCNMNPIISQVTPVAGQVQLELQRKQYADGPGWVLCCSMICNKDFWVDCNRSS